LSTQVEDQGLLAETDRGKNNITLNDITGIVMMSKVLYFCREFVLCVSIVIFFSVLLESILSNPFFFKRRDYSANDHG